MKSRFFADKPRLIFFLCYTLLYILAVKAAVYVLPFVLAMLLAVVMKPLFDYLRRRFRFRSSFAATSLTLLVFGALFAIVGFLLFLAIRQAAGLLTDNREVISEYIRSPKLTDLLKENLMSGNLLTAVSAAAQTLFQAVPAVVTFVVITFVTTVFLMHHLDGIRDRLLSRAGEYRFLLGRVFHIAYAMVRKFLRSYLILYAITFIEAALIFYLTGTEYPLAFAFITAVADILPVLGPGIVYVPLSIVFILQKNYIAGVILLVYFLLTVILRQILEPRIVSDSVKVHPLVVLAAIYFSIVSMNIWVLFYVISVFMVFRVLNSAGVFEKG
ncbi:MAG: AI-2E family transporter [Ruminococcus sp.]|uniref:AI-2E family transporter n=1 Tax=Ruminococcus sp. TaxID=41978 RepID=UPI0028739D93|nr:AI-2E family transporter [Ruminococcus sp.]MBQ3284937.1 AI-2E family transporter [Ruminococcus sp.]